MEGFDEIFEQAKKANLTIDEGLRQLSNISATIERQKHKGGFKSEDYQTMLKEIERAKELKKQLDERYSK